MDPLGYVIPAETQAEPRRQRAHAVVRVEFARVGERTEAARVFETGGLRVKFPNAARPCQAVIVNTGGGIAGGDRAQIDFALGERAEAEITTQSAEKIYRAEGEAAMIATRLVLGAGAKLDWLPQETILFDKARLQRRLDVDVAADAALLIVECFVFGRAAMGEARVDAEVADRWRIRRAGRLLFAEDMALRRASAALDRVAVGDGASALATLFVMAPNPEAVRDDLRIIFGRHECRPGERLEAGVSALDGYVVARAVSSAPCRLRAALLQAIVSLRGRPAPRVWL